MKLRSFFLISISCLLMSVMLGTLQSCRDTSDVSAVLDRGDSLVISNPDSVLAMLDSIREEVAKSPKSIRMRYELLNADAQNKAYVDFTTDSVMKEVVDYYDSHGTPSQKMKAHYLLGCVYRDLHEAPMTLQCYNEAVDIADTLSPDCDYRILMSVYGQMADLYYSLHLPKEELRCFNKYEEVAHILHDTIAIIEADEFKLRPYLSLNMKDSVLSIVERARAIRKSLNIKEDTYSLGTIISIYIERGEINKAKEVLNVFENELSQCSLTKHDSLMVSLYLHDKGRIALYDNDFVLARNCFYKLLISPHKWAAYDGLLKLYTIINVADSISKYSQLYVAEKDSEQLNSNIEEVIRFNSMYNYGRMQKMSRDNAELYAKSQTHKFYLACVILSLFVMIVFITIAHKKRQKNNIERIKQLAYQLESNKEKLHSILEEAEERAVSINRKDNEIVHLQEQIHNMETILKSTSKNMVTQSFFNTDIYGMIKSKSQYTSTWQPVTNEEWQMLISKFRIYYSGYSSFLSASNNLTEDQYKVCMLMALNFRESEIALLLGVDSARVNRLKMQINEKLFMKQDAKSLRTNLLQHC